SDSPKHALLNEEVLVAVTWSGEAFIANSEDQNFLYAYPKEGYSLWMDSFAIPRGAKNVENAHKFMNFILRPDISAKISQEMGYATPNQAAIKLLPPEIQNNPIIYPSQEELKRGEFQTDVQDALLVYEKYWNELKNN
ncbi:MAG TPA: spermidine/putrescine ABC transporter substrate-binding protein PotD, partial [Desulfonauticus sp.]|nr:spermidine/putrescine ABC transporter substrate-binding protein PotD [Desulfonauticus sp.]